MKTWTIVAILLGVCGVVLGQLPEDFGRIEGPESPSRAAELLKATAVASHTQVTPGKRFHLAVDIRIADGWVYYSPNPGGKVFPAQIEVTAGPFRSGEVIWGADHRKEVSVGGVRFANNVYEGRTVAYVPLSVPIEIAHGDYEIVVRLKGQICSDVCLTLQDDVTASTTVRVGDVSTVNPKWEGDPEYREGLKRLTGKVARGPTLEFAAVIGKLGLAVLAGLILNVMPCVLPIIPLRILTVVQMGGGKRRRFVTLGLSFAGGVLLFFVALAILNAILHLTVGRAFDWSEHYQSTVVRIALTMIVVGLAANLFGLFNVVVPRGIAGLGQSGVQAGGHLTSVGMGLMLAVLATPCSFAILTGTLAWAQLQPLWLGTMAFLLLGVGMAAPHAILCGFPKLVDYLPKPGRWMEIFKQTMGFALLLFAVYLIDTLPRPLWVVAFTVVFTFALWVWGSWVRYDAPIGRKLVIRGIAVVLVLGMGWWMLTPERTRGVIFEQFDRARIDEARNNGRIVLVEFTASWCTSCKIIDWVVYRDEKIAQLLKEKGVLVMKADVTNKGTLPADYLKDTFDKPVPLSAVFPPSNAPAILLEGVFSKKDLIRAVDEAAQTR